MPRRRVLALFSGGLDSVVLVAWLQRQHYDVMGWNAWIGQPTRETDAAHQAANNLGLEVKGFSFCDFSKQLESKIFGTGFVAMRNPIILSLAMNQAFQMGISLVAYGGQRSEFPDNSPEFVERFNFMVEKAMEPELMALMAPLVDMTKVEIIQLAARLKAPIFLSRSCAADGQLSCGTCYKCEPRLDAFKKAGYMDPIAYAIDVHDRQGKRRFPSAQ